MKKFIVKICLLLTIILSATLTQGCAVHHTHTPPPKPIYVVPPRFNSIPSRPYYHNPPNRPPRTRPRVLPRHPGRGLVTDITYDLAYTI